MRLNLIRQLCTTYTSCDECICVNKEGECEIRRLFLEKPSQWKTHLISKTYNNIKAKMRS